jgi:hypothetical protein
MPVASCQQDSGLKPVGTVRLENAISVSAGQNAGWRQRDISLGRRTDGAADGRKFARNRLQFVRGGPRVPLCGRNY